MDRLVCLFKISWKMFLVFSWFVIFSELLDNKIQKCVKLSGAHPSHPCLVAGKARRNEIFEYLVTIENE